ncbi:hypothetical protein R3P38DRAFT_3352554 [Favolaschia claudopus]|uniref:Uncharacterized protein n=1 Tax=Favolaschia claudopus TaxID=2862362 RepID=A0AAW0C230_9AGAR
MILIQIQISSCSFSLQGLAALYPINSLTSPSPRTMQQQPLTRRTTRSSIHSWWSDSNPNLQGPATINLHSAAKPLMRFLHHRQAVDIIKKNRFGPLTDELLDIYASYLPWNFVSTSTKALILSELEERARVPSNAQVIVDSPIFIQLQQMLEWTLDDQNRDREAITLQIAGRPLMESLHHKEALSFIQKNSQQPLSTGILDGYAAYLSWNLLSWSTKGLLLSTLKSRASVESDTQAVLNSPVLCILQQMVEFPEIKPENQDREALALAAAAKYVIQCLHHTIVSALIHKSQDVPLSANLLDKYAAYLTLPSISDSTKATIFDDLKSRACTDDSEAQAVVDSPVFSRVQHVLESREKQQTSILTAAAQALLSALYHQQVLSHEAKTRDKRLSATILQAYASYLSLSSTCISWETKMILLSQLDFRAQQLPSNAQAVVVSPVFALLGELLDSPHIGTRALTCKLLGHLASHASVLELNPCPKLVNIFRNDADFAVEQATFSLSKIAISLDGAQAIVHAIFSDVSDTMTYIWPLWRPVRFVSITSGTDSLCETAITQDLTSELMGQLATHGSELTGACVSREETPSGDVVWKLRLLNRRL